MRRSHCISRMGELLSSHRDRMSVAVAGLVLMLATLAPHPAFATAANPEDDPKPAGQRQGTTGGFAFGAPRGFFAIKFGLYAPRAESDIFVFNAEQLTLDLSSYNAPLIGVDFGYSVNDRVDIVIGFEFSSSSPVSEMRDFIDEFGAPITQQTRLRQAPITVSVRFNLMERGRSVGSFAWVPNSVVPYVGVGGGINWWRYEQFGDFVDFADFTIFTDHFRTQGWEPIVHAFGGLDWAVSPRFVLEFEGRYSWAEGQLAPAFVGFEPIDLAGFRGMVGASFRF